MRKCIAILLAIALMLALCACGESEVKSKVSLDELSEAVGRVEEKTCSFAKTEADGETLFSADFSNDSYLFGSVIAENYSGTAGKSGYVKTLEYRFTFPKSDVVEKLFNGLNLADVRKLVKEDIGSFTGYQLAYYLLLMAYSDIMCCLREGTARNATVTEAAEAMKLLIEAKDTPQTVDGWTFSVKLDDDGATTVISAVYTG